MGELEAEDFREGPLRQVFVALRGLVEAKEEVTPQALLAHADETAHADLAAFALREVPPERVQETIERDVRRLVERRIVNRRRALTKQLEGIGPGSEQEAILAELNECNDRLSKLLGRRIVGL